MRRPVNADLIPWVARALSSSPRYVLQRSIQSVRARVRGESDLILVFVNPRDPFGLPLLQALLELQERFRVRFQLHTVWQQDDEIFPEPSLWHKWAQQDAINLAKLYNFTPPYRPTPPSNIELTSATTRLLNAEKAGEGLSTAAGILTDLWSSEAHSGSVLEPSDHHNQSLLENEKLLRRLGHYQGSMTRYLGEWFWGVDRLDHLERSLTDQGLKRDNAAAITYTHTWADLTKNAVRLPDHSSEPGTALEVFFSIRSPYSYLGLERAIQLAEVWNIPLHLRPVLPMVMRGLSVPDAKKWYIFHDTKREASKLGLPYGFVADPLGPGVERCYALFEYARSLGREIEYMRTYARAVNAEGIRSETDTGLKLIVERSGLDWHKAKALLDDQSWREWAEVNRQAMYNCGLWGVPSFRYGDVTCWGQDRLWVIENEIKNKSA
ncbi:DsbA family protein [Marinobacter sp. S6332]|uniref:DsbA family protein n=1 Tax=Marinobacter sp. S6332 TaxID=2926403 RepID=UPI001FF15311|nr:DsbA family protein [Marinobacter sp. S6332]MCK0163906.1 DsbA family protein [Marinobacter sp. S6332]